MTTLYTVGHSTRTAGELVALLQEAEVEVLVDVRRFPGSRRHPWHAREAMSASLAAAGIGYRWYGEALGGRRKQLVAEHASRNRAWKVAAFRHYADAMATEGFRAAAAEVETLAERRTVALLCAERLWWQCHRRLLADLYTARGQRVVHLLIPGKHDEHRLCPWGRVEGDGMVYPNLFDASP